MDRLKHLSIRVRVQAEGGVGASARPEGLRAGSEVDTADVKRAIRGLQPHKARTGRYFLVGLNPPQTLDTKHLLLLFCLNPYE